MFHDPSFGIASRVFPKFHPGFNAFTAAEAVTGVNAGHAPEVVPAAVVVVATVVGTRVVEEVLIDVVVVLTDVVEVLMVVTAAVVVLLVVAAEDGAVPGTHWEYPKGDQQPGEHC